MRPSFATFTAILISLLMVSSVFVLEHSSEVESDQTELSQAEPFFASGRGTSTSFLATGGSSSQNIDADFIESTPTGGWAIGSSFNQSLTFGSQTLSPTSPYTYGEFFIALVDGSGNWQTVFGADHSFGSGGLSSLNDITIDAGGEILVTGFFYGEIAFSGGGGPAAVISNTNPNYHQEGFIAKADPMGNWLWAHSFTTLVNGSGEYSTTKSIELNQMGEVFVTGTFQGETDFI